MKTLILGGVRSGKSRHAETLARSHAPVTVIATATADDEEMAARIARHRRDRPGSFAVIEEPLRLAAALTRASSESRAVIVDCLTLWLSNLLERDPNALEAETKALATALAASRAECILISNEVGLGIIPPNPLARRFGDAAGSLHQELARVCDRVIFMVAGMPLVVKGVAG
jgi:adenosylcobinamide kinase/adenosylcobinamide-phosphate guanylyltransferase